MLRQHEISGDIRFWRTIRTLPLGAKLGLAGASFLVYWLLLLLLNDLDWPGDVETALGHLPGLVFGLLVMGPYAAALRLRLPRILAMALASEVIYYLAVQFVIDGPFSYNTITPYFISGAGAAVLVGFTVVLLGQHRLRWQLVALMLAAGLIGGGAFRWIPSGESDLGILGGHLTWQLLVCLALHLGLSPRPPLRPQAA